MLQIKNLKKSYKGFAVLHGLNMSLEKGDVYGFLGPNGCGKTTTMNIICDIITKDEGEVNFENKEVKIGYLPETPALYGYMNGYEYLDFIGACSEYDGDITARTAEVLEITGMTEGAKRRIKGYSRGMNQRIGIAAALYGKPDLIILDEPTSALDPEGRAEVMEIIKKLAETGSTIILCTHILSDVERVANKVGIIRNGVIPVEGSIEEIKRRFEGNVAINIRLLEQTPEAVTALSKIELAEKSDISMTGGITVYAKDGVSEKDFYNKVIMTLAENNILPEAVSFKRLSLEEIYIGVTSGRLI
ncbi:MAG: ABC transporter ATP-binding protein [Oscillospiraceae bacterium]|nr:ABC transporter ATP-binding protein [Oscillospiraceae bacterium]